MTPYGKVYFSIQNLAYPYRSYGYMSQGDKTNFATSMGTSITCFWNGVSKYMIKFSRHNKPPHIFTPSNGKTFQRESN